MMVKQGKRSIFYPIKKNTNYKKTGLVMTLQKTKGKRGCMILVLMMLMGITSVFTMMGHAAGSSLTWQPLTVIPTQTTATATMPATCLDASGNLHVAWVDTSGLNGSSANPTIYYKNRNAASGAWSNVEIVSTEGTVTSGKPSMAIDPSNNVYVVWSDNANYTGAGTNYHIFYRVRSAATGTWGSLEVISTGSSNAQNPSIAVLSWAAAVAWEDPSNVMIRWKNFSSGQWSSIDTIATGNSLYTHYPSITFNQSYAMHLVYVGYLNGMLGPKYCVTYQSKQLGGTSWSTAVHLYGVDADTLVDYFPTIKVDSAGNSHITFFEIGQEPPVSGAGMFYIQYNAQLKSWQSPEEFDVSGVTPYGAVSMVLDSSSSPQIAWCQGYKIYYACRYANRTWTSPLVISTGMVGSPVNPAIAASAPSTLHVVWDNTTRLYYATTTVASSIPVADFVANATLVRPNCSAKFTFTGNPGVQPTTYQWNFGDGTANATVQNPVHVFSTIGTYSITLAINDSTGHGAKKVKSNYITVAANQPPVASFTFSPATPAVSQALQLTDTSVDHDGTIAAWQWNFGDGSANSTVKNPTHAYASAGNFTVTLTVTDNEGALGVARKTVSVIVAQPPTASFTYTPASPVVTQTVQFTDKSTDSDSTIASWQWNFGDGSANSTSQNPTHAYSSTGTYTVTLTVTDNLGLKGVAKKSITISSQFMYVQAISMSCTKTGSNYNIYTTVTVYSWAGTGLSGVTVTIQLTTPSGTKYTLSGTTGSGGTVQLMKSCSKTSGTYTSTVTNLVKSGWVYNSTKNVVTSKSLVV